MFPDPKELSPFHHDEFPDLEEFRVKSWAENILYILIGLGVVFWIAVFVWLIIK